MYRSSSCQGESYNVFFNLFQDLMSEINERFRNYLIVVCGDFNIHLENENTQKNEFLTLLNMTNLSITITTPTRVVNNSHSLVDNILVNNTEHILNISNDDFGFSDHYGQKITLQNPDFNHNSNTIITRKRIFSSKNKALFKNLISAIDWSALYTKTDVNQAYDIFYEYFNSCFNVAFPVKNIKINNENKCPEWMTIGIKTSCRNKRSLLYIKKFHTTNTNFINHVQNYCKILKNVIILAKRNFSNNCIINSSNKIRSTWKLVKANLKQKPNYTRGNIDILNQNNELITDPVSVATEFQNFYLNIGETLTENMSSKKEAMEYVTVLKLNNRNSFYFSPITETDIKRIINNFEQKNSTGMDDIPITIIKEQVEYFLKPITYLINLSLSTGTFPDCLKHAVIKPLFKKGEKTEISNYRPISLLSVISKILEAVVKEQINNYLERNRILSESQYGFRHGKNTTAATFDLVSNLNKTLENKNIPITIFCDLSKAFDCVDHKILLDKMEYYGIRGIVNDWFKSYLSDRTMSVEVKSFEGDQINNIRSNPNKIKCGVPQGSILAPTLFLIYVNDIVVNFPLAKFSQFADDTSITLKHRELDELLNITKILLEDVSDWFAANKLVLNMSKTFNILFQPNKKLHQTVISTNIGEVTPTSSTKFLGLHIDQQLNWKTHITELNIKLSRAVFAINTIRQNIGFSVGKTVYYAYFYSLMQYGIEFWGNSVNSQSTFLIQKKAIRALCGLKSRDSCRDYFKELEIFTLTNLYIYKISIITFTEQNNLYTHSDVHDHDTRGKNVYVVPSYNLDVNRKGPVYVGIKIFNHLPEIIRRTPSVNIFKKKLKKMLKSRIYYTLDEFFKDSHIS